ncbi:MAG: DUF732 domain-containing protein [Mycobacterium sp.]|nr:DUF732 domain-containing protein [Mycobacterium sp.]
MATGRQRRAREMMSGALAAAAAGAVCMLNAVCARADPPDDEFLQAMQANGLAQYFSSPANQISEAKRVCAGMRNDARNAPALAFVIGRDHGMVDKSVEVSFLDNAIDFYCPDVPLPQF